MSLKNHLLFLPFIIYLIIICAIYFILVTKLSAQDSNQNYPYIQRNNLFNGIALCESNNTATAHSTLSTAKGRFQFLDGTWKYYGQKLWGENLVNKNVLNYEDNTELAIWIYGKYGTGDWLPSAHCWNVVKK